MIAIKPLASSSRGNAHFVTDGVTPLLLDCGLPWREIRAALDFKTSVLAGCLVTHEHKDHCKGIKEAIKAGINTYCSQEVISSSGISSHRLLEIKPLRKFYIGTWACLPFPLKHDVPCLGFLLASREGGKLAYITDTAYCKYVFQGLTHVMIECNYSPDILRKNNLEPEVKKRIIRNHMSLEAVKGFLKANDLSRAEEIHLLHLSDNNSDAARFKREVQEASGRMVFVASSQ